jgi:predicted nucleic acid-binding protein
MSEWLLDTGIFIRHLRRYAGYNVLLQQITMQGEVSFSVFTRLEVLRGMKARETKDTFALLNSLITIPMSAEIADLAAELLCTWRSKGMLLGDGDAIIAATALHYDLELVTTNPRHFPMPELTVWQANESGQLIKRQLP